MEIGLFHANIGSTIKFIKSDNVFIELKFVPNFKNDPFRTISSHLFRRIHVYLLQKLGSEGHFDVFNMPKS